MLISFACKLQSNRADCTNTNGICTVHVHIWKIKYDYHSTHFLYKILDSKKTSRFQFSVPDLWEIHRNLKQQKKLNSHGGFFRKSPFCTFSCINPGFGGPWDMLRIFFYCHLHNASKECFWPKSRIYAGKSTERGFSKKAIVRIEMFLLF